MEEDVWGTPDSLRTFPVYVREPSGFDLQTHCNRAVKLRNAALSHDATGD